MVEDDKKKTDSTGCLILFAVPFTAVGVGMLGIMLWSVSDWVRMRSWVATPAEILEARLERHDDDDGPKYKAIARYAYRFDGRKYENDRVSIQSSADDIGTYHQDRVAQLQRLMRQQQPGVCYVNSRVPARSILFRELRYDKLGFQILLALAFGGSGMGMIAFATYGRRKAQRINVLSQQHPDEPWRWRDDWAKGRVDSSNQANMLVALFMAMIWNLVSTPLLFVLPKEIRAGNYLAALGYVFPAVGIGLVIWAVIAVRRHFKFGESVFQMASVPGVIGGPLAGVVRTNINLRPTDGFRQTLSCVREIRSADEDRKMREHLVWQATNVLQREMAGNDDSQSIIPVQFHIPYDALPSSTAQDICRVFWRLEIRADALGVDYESTFEVPVFRTADSSPNYQPDDAALADYAREVNIADVYREAGIRRGETARGIEIVFPLFRNLGMAIGATAMLAIWLGAVTLMWQFGVWLFAVVFGLFGLLVALMVAELWFWKSEITVGDREITVRAGVLGFTKSKRFDRDDIKAVVYTSGSQSGQKLYHDLHIQTRDGKQHCFGKRVGHQSSARAIVDDIKRVLGMETHRPDSAAALTVDPLKAEAKSQC